MLKALNLQQKFFLIYYRLQKHAILVYTQSKFLLRTKKIFKHILEICINIRGVFILTQNNIEK